MLCMLCYNDEYQFVNINYNHGLVFCFGYTEYII